MEKEIQMTTPIDLGSLTFTAEDFKTAHPGNNQDLCEMPFNGEGFKIYITPENAATLANALLRERLGRAEIVTGYYNVVLPGEEEEWVYHSELAGNDTHTALLVCVREIK